MLEADLNEGADGYVLFEALPGQLEAFVNKVVPILQAQGIYKLDYEGDTFRKYLGLPFSVNRHTAVRQDRDSIAAE